MLYPEKFLLLTELSALIVGGVVGLGESDGVLARAWSGPAHPSGARMALQKATHDIHERMHRHPALARLAAGTIGCDEYRRVLARSYGFYAMAEPVLGLSGKLTDCIVQDLVELGMTPAAI